jgi:hypothetical protein
MARGFWLAHDVRGSTTESAELARQLTQPNTSALRAGSRRWTTGPSGRTLAEEVYEIWPRWKAGLLRIHGAGHGACERDGGQSIQHLVTDNAQPASCRRTLTLWLAPDHDLGRRKMFREALIG